MRVPSYRKHLSGPARVTINGQGYPLYPFGLDLRRCSFGQAVYFSAWVLLNIILPEMEPVKMEFAE